MVLFTMCCALLLYGIGFWLGKKYQLDDIMNGVYGVLSQIDQTSLTVDSVTYYYSKEAYDKEVQRLKEEAGEEYYE